MKRSQHDLRKASAWAAIGSVLAAGALPVPPPVFKGQIGLSAKDSTPDFPKEVQAPKGAPNIVLILLDDVGYGASDTFGGPISTPTLDRLAKNGLRYAEFHTTALSSPTGAALLTGDNHHMAHTGVRVPEKEWAYSDVSAPLTEIRTRYIFFTA